MINSSGAYTWLSEVEKELSQIFGSQYKIEAIEPLSGGSINEAARLKSNTNDVFIKWNQVSKIAMFEAEKKGLSALRKANSSLAIPDCLSVGTAGGYSYLLLEHLDFISSQQKYEENLGRGLAQLHKNTHASFGFEADNFCGSTPQKNDRHKSWRHFYLENRLQFLWDKLLKRGSISKSQNQQFELFKRAVQLQLETDASPSLIHGDLWSGNAAPTTKGPAIFDPACYYAHREAELGMMLLFRGFGSRVFEAYEEEFPLEKNWKDRVPLYQLYHLLNHYWLFGGGYGNSALSIIKKFAK